MIMPSSGTPSNQAGVALVMALMIVALVAIIAVEISWRFELSISRSGNRWHGMQARAYLEGAEQLAMRVLVEDAETRENSGFDHTGEPWAQDADPFPTDHGWVSGKIIDAQGRFNLNTMIPDPNKCPDGTDRSRSGFCQTPETECGKYTEAQRLFVRLLQTVNLAEEQVEDFDDVDRENNRDAESEDSAGFADTVEPVFLEQAEAEAIAEAVIDWLDADSEITGFGGAESDYYEQLTPPTTIANGPFISVSELQVIKGMRPDLYQKLTDPHEGFVVALPQEEVDRINLGTAPVNVVRTLTPLENCDLRPMAEDEAAQIVSDLADPEPDFEDMAGYKNSAIFPTIWQGDGGQDQANFPETMLRLTQSNYFLFFSESAVGEDHIRSGWSLIKRVTDQSSDESGTQIEVVRRTDANF